VIVPRSGLRVVVRDIGGLQVLLAGATVAPLVVSLLYGEWYSALGFAISIVIIAGLGAAAFQMCRRAGEPRGYHAMLIAGAGWLVSVLLGAVPILLIAHLTPDDVAQGFVPAGETYRSSLEILRNPLHAIFESTSCYTTAGFTLVVHEPSIGKGLLYYRSHMVWLGGAGMIVLALAIIPRPGSAGGLHLYASESSAGKVKPSILGTARAIRTIYVQVTAAIALFLFVATLVFTPERGVEAALFDAINHSMAGFGTGGVSTLDNGIAEFGSYAMEVVHLVPMIVGMIALPLLYVVVRDRNLRLLWRDLQFRMMVGVLAFGIAVLTLLLWLDPAAQEPFREASFQLVSGLATCGWQTSNIGAWRDPAVLLVMCAMLSGGAAGSTVGGIKLIRSYVIFRAVSLRIKRAFLPPEAVVPFKVGERTVPAQEIQREIADAAVFTFLYLAIFVAGTLVAASFVDPTQYTLADVAFETMSAQTGTGLSTGITEPNMPAPVEVTFILLMWIGRLEIFPVIILLRALFVWHRPQPRRL
jgi:trk system potassium uptake protein TrkH